MSFIPKGSSSDAGIAKFVAGGGQLMLEKVTDDGEREIGMQGRVQHVNGDGIVHDLGRLLQSYYASLPKDPRLLTTPEKEELLRQILSALGRELALTPYGQDLARRLAGLDTLDGQTDSKQWERQGQSGSQNPNRENGGYRMPSEPANRPSSVAKSADEWMRDVRLQILDLSKRIGELVERQQARR